MKTQNCKKIADIQPELLTGSKAFIKDSKNILVKINQGFAVAILTPVKADQFIF